MSVAAAAVLKPLGEGRIALEGVEVRATLRGLVSEVQVEQTYINLEESNIEAVYTFPLPSGAVLLELSLELNGRTLRGTVVPRPQAEDRYEDAVTDGDTAVLLQQTLPGLYTMNVGNLQPGERALVRFRYAQLMHWQGDSLRVQLPTTVAPRYGDPVAAGLAPHETPEYTLSASFGLRLSLHIEGALAGARIECPTHPVKVELGEGTLDVGLSGKSVPLDRDFVLVLREPAQASGQALWARDGAGYVAVASFHPSIPASEGGAAPRCIKLVVDCSGSMNGDSIDQARRALLEILDLLTPRDTFNVFCFGRAHRSLFPSVVRATQGAIEQARGFVRGITADMGGTEMHAALEAAYRDGGSAPEVITPDVLLITDGEVYDQAAIIDAAARSAHRVFTVGVGSSVSEALVRGIAEASGGAAELVTPREDMAERIVRHFRRIRQPRARVSRVLWPSNPAVQAPTRVEAVYGGDTVHVFAWLPERPGGQVHLDLDLEGGRGPRQSAELEGDGGDGGAGGESELPRIAAHARLAELSASEASDLAIRYQLVTEHTSCVMVYERAEGAKAGELPVLRKVPHTLAAGWGGMGSVHDAPPVSGLPMAPPGCDRSVVCDDLAGFEAFEDQSMPAPLARPSGLPPRTGMIGVGALVSALNRRYADGRITMLDMDAVDDLEALGLPEEIAEGLRELVGRGWSERDLVVEFLVVLSEGPHGVRLDRQVKRLIRKAHKDLTPEQAVRSTVADLLRL